MAPKKVWPTLAVALITFLSDSKADEVLNARPGKGMSLIPGDYAEYTNTQTAGDKIVGQLSTIMVATGKTDGYEGVMVINVDKGKPVSKRIVHYDLTKSKVERGELIGTGKESLIINGKKFECTWEKRRDDKVVATFWKSSDLPFERYAKVQLEAPNGQKMVTELMLFGPDPSVKEGDEKFLKRLSDLNALLDN